MTVSWPVRLKSPVVPASVRVSRVLVPSVKERALASPIITWGVKLSVLNPRVLREPMSLAERLFWMLTRSLNWNSPVLVSMITFEPS